MDTIVAGSLAALSVDILIYPLDTIKTRIQDPSYSKPSSSSPTGKLRFSGLYQGVGSVVAVTLPAAALFFTTYEGVKNVLLPPGWENEGGADSSSLLQGSTDTSHRRVRVVGSHALASATAELASCVILTPAEMIKQRAQVARNTASPPASTSQNHNSKLSSSSTVSAFRETFLNAPSSTGSGGNQLGKQLWRGYIALASRNLPYTAIQFPLYEHFRAELSVLFGLGKPTADGREKKVPVADTQSSDGARLLFQDGNTARQAEGKKMTRNQEILWSGVSSALAGAGAGSFAALVTTPVDVAKTRIMLSKTDSSGNANPLARRGAPQGVISTLRGIWVTEGIRGVMKGGLLRSAWTALGAGVYLSSYETGRIWFRENYMRG